MIIEKILDISTVVGLGVLAYASYKLGEMRIDEKCKDWCNKQKETFKDYRFYGRG